jgi:hypothetical protein
MGKMPLYNRCRPAIGTELSIAGSLNFPKANVVVMDISLASTNESDSLRSLLGSVFSLIAGVETGALAASELKEACREKSKRYITSIRDMA